MTRPARSLWRSRHLPRLRAPPATPTLAHFCRGLQNLLCPLEGTRPEGGPCADRLLAPIYSLPTPCPLQLSLPSRQPSLLWLRVLGSPKSSYFPNLSQKPPEITVCYIHQRKSQNSLRSPEEWGGCPQTPHEWTDLLCKGVEGPCLLGLLLPTP